MAEIAWTDEAQRWLSDIFEYIAADNPQAAVRTVQGIYERAQDLKRFPAARVALRRHIASRTGIALRPLPNRVPRQGDGNIDVLGVFHGALDITRYQL